MTHSRRHPEINPPECSREIPIDRELWRSSRIHRSVVTSVTLVLGTGWLILGPRSTITDEKLFWLSYACGGFDIGSDGPHRAEELWPFLSQWGVQQCKPDMLVEIRVCQHLREEPEPSEFYLGQDSLTTSACSSASVCAVLMARTKTVVADQPSQLCLRQGFKRRRA